MNHEPASTRRFQPRLKSFQEFSCVALGEAIEIARCAPQPTHIRVLGSAAAFALCDARQRYAEHPDVWVEAFPAADTQLPPTVRVAVTVAALPLVGVAAQTCELAPLDVDDVIAYLLDNHPGACQSVLQRLGEDHYRWVGNDLEIWDRLLRMLAQSDVTSEQALWQLFVDEAVRPIPGDPGDAEQANALHALAQSCLATLGVERSEQVATLPLCERLLAIPCNRHRLIADFVADRVTHADVDCLRHPLPPELIREIAARLRQWPEAAGLLEKHARGDCAAMALSIRHAMHGWRPRTLYDLQLDRAWLERASWPAVRLNKVKMQRCRMRAIDLSHAVISASRWLDCDLSHCSLAGVSASDFRLSQCDARHGDLSRLQVKGADFYDCDFTAGDWRDARVEDTYLQHCLFRDADLRDLSLCGGSIRACDFSGADLRGLIGSGAMLVNCVFVQTKLDGADLKHTRFRGLDLEDAELKQVDFRYASLGHSVWTGSRADSLDFCHATLVGAKLAEILWTGCDLRGADLRGVDFHFGSTRCGRVGSPYPSHGTRTGFYTDSREELYFRDPEEVRRGALLGCDLRGAKIDGVDFYLIDLRDSLLDPPQRRQAAASGAILSSF